MNPLVTVITATLNAEKNLQQSLESVRTQTYPFIDYIIVDGGSTDQTITILQSFNRILHETNAKSHIKFRWVSERDKGIADAFNKGLKMARGEYIYFLGADDVLKSPDSIQKMMEGVDQKTDMIICGKVDRIRNTKKYSVIYTSHVRFAPWMLLYKMGLPHQGMFMNRKYFHTYGLFDTRLKYAMDYDLLLRSYKKFPRVVLKDRIVAGWREGGVGKNRIYDILQEYQVIRKRNHIAPFWLLRIIHIASCIRYLPELVNGRVIGALV